jgi:PAS domain-containing protein
MNRDAMGDPSRTNDILYSILAQIGDAVIVADREGNFLVFNPAAEQMFGDSDGQVPLAEWPGRYAFFCRTR